MDKRPVPDFALRAATREDFGFAWTLYRDLMKSPTEDLLPWNEASQKSVVEDALSHAGTTVVVLADRSVGWLQTVERADAVHIGQLYLRADVQNQGIGSAIVRRLCDSAREEQKAVTLDVMKNNPARRLYERLGFVVVGESEYKYEMRWREPG